MVDKYKDTKIVTEENEEYVVLYSMEKDGKVYALINDLHDMSNTRVVQITEMDGKVAIDDVSDESIIADVFLLANK